jgi:uncharacterized protein YbaP (TraB family)
MEAIMRTNMRRVQVLSILLVVWFIPQAFGADGDKNYLWKVTSDSGGEVYLLGSIHIGKKDWYPLPKEIEDAFEKSKFLVVEADVSKVDQGEVMKLIGAKGMYPFGDSVSKHVSKETGEKIDAYVEKSNAPAIGINQMKPWLLSMTVTELEMKKMGFDENEGIDIHFLKEAKDNTKEVLELESIEFQLNLLSGLDDELQEKMLLSTLEEMDNMKTDLPRMVQLWQKGDAKGLEELVNKVGAKHPEYKTLMKKILDDRNVGMVEKIEGYLKTKDIHFVVVGSAHLCGEKGIVKALEGKKYKVEQIAKSGALAKEKEPVGAGK